jgi:hypothetical protein
MSEDEWNWIGSMTPQGDVIRPKWLVNTHQISSRRACGVDKAFGTPGKTLTDPLTKPKKTFSERRAFYVA